MIKLCSYQKKSHYSKWHEDKLGETEKVYKNLLTRGGGGVWKASLNAERKKWKDLFSEAKSHLVAKQKVDVERRK